MNARVGKNNNAEIEPIKNLVNIVDIYLLT